MRDRYDAVVVGAGPVGSMAALSLARRGDEVLLVEANPDAARRFAGEWLHPPAVEAMEALGVQWPASGQRGRGFVVFPDDGSEPIVLPYSDGTHGLACEHHVLVEHIRAAALARPEVTYQSFSRVLEVADGQLHIAPSNGRNAGSRGEADSADPTGRRVRASEIVGADGRSSVVRAASGGKPGHAPCSRMAGLVLDVDLPFEGYGHVFLGGPGSVLAYRIAPRKVRVCVDVPRKFGRLGAAALIDGYTPHLAHALRGPFVEALRQEHVSWASIAVQRRRFYGRSGTSLVGDSVGYYHPLTAAGMTLGFHDALELARGKGHARFQRQRLHDILVPELLAVALYEVFTDPSDEMRAMRRAVYQLWRSSDSERRRTMRFLACQDTRVPSFLYSFARVMGVAGLGLALPKEPKGAMERVLTVGRWLGRGVSLVVPTFTPLR